MNNIDLFKETQNIIASNNALLRMTEKAVSNTSILNENMRSMKKPHFDNCNVVFEENLTLRAAFNYADAGKRTAILDFANPVEPGGGVLRGADAQEEYLCRASNLYYCLDSKNARPYYFFHNSILKRNQFKSMFLASDKIIYSPKVTFFREDDRYFPGESDYQLPSEQVYTDKWRIIDVITCAAPFFSSSRYILPNGDLYHLFLRRIRNIFEVAIEHNIESLVLGAFGCGAFHNPPAVVADAFRDALLEDRHRQSFSDVVFAVKRSDRFCENIEAFELAFSSFPEKCLLGRERNKRRFFE